MAEKINGIFRLTIIEKNENKIEEKILSSLDLLYKKFEKELYSIVLEDPIKNKSHGGAFLKINKNNIISKDNLLGKIKSFFEDFYTMKLIKIHIYFYLFTKKYYRFKLYDSDCWDMYYTELDQNVTEMKDYVDFLMGKNLLYYMKIKIFNKKSYDKSLKSVKIIDTKDSNLKINFPSKLEDIELINIETHDYGKFLIEFLTTLNKKEYYFKKDSEDYKLYSIKKIKTLSFIYENFISFRYLSCNDIYLIEKTLNKMFWKKLVRNQFNISGIVLIENVY